MRSLAFKNKEKKTAGIKNDGKEDAFASRACLDGSFLDWNEIEQLKVLNSDFAEIVSEFMKESGLDSTSGKELESFLEIIRQAYENLHPQAQQENLN